MILRVDPSFEPIKLTIKELHTAVSYGTECSSVLLRVQDLRQVVSMLRETNVACAMNGECVERRLVSSKNMAKLVRATCDHHGSEDLQS